MSLDALESDKCGLGRSARMLQIITSVRLLAGFYSPDLLPSRRSQILARIYCFCVVAAYSWSTFDLSSNSIITNLFLADILTNFIWSTLSNISITNYFLFVKHRCQTKESKGLLIFVLNCIIFVVTLEPLAIFTSAAFDYVAVIGTSRHNFVSLFLRMGVRVGLTLSETPRLICVGLLYCDVYALFSSMRDAGFRVGAGAATCSARSYIRIYEQIQRNFQKYESPSKSSILINIVFTLLEVLVDIHKLTTGIKTEISVLTSAIFIVHCMVILFLPLALLELATNTQEKILVLVLNYRMGTNDCAARNEMRRVSSYIRARPLRYTLWRAVPLDAKLILSLVSLSVTYVIAVLQLSHTTTAAPLTE